MDEQLTLTLQIEKIDKIDEFLIDEILLQVQNKDTFELLKFWNSKHNFTSKAEEKFFEKTRKSIEALVKANANRRNYIKIKDTLVSEIKSDEKGQKTKIDVLYNKVDAFVLVENFFTQHKTSLDLLAQSLHPIYGIHLQTWAKAKDKSTGKELSGLKVVNSLKNLPKDIRKKAEPLTKLIEDNIESVTKIVSQRDNFVHFGDYKNIQGFRYSVEKDDVFPPIIRLEKDKAMYIHEYQEEVMNFMMQFTQAFIATLLSNLFPDMFIGKRKDGTFGWLVNINDDTFKGKKESS